MSVLQRHNGQLVALSLAAVCAMFITHSVFGYDQGEEDEGRILVIAGLCAVVTTWVFWKLLVANGRRLLIFRGAVAGALSGLFAIPFFLFAGAFAHASSGCPDVACVFNEILVAETLTELALGSAILSIFGFIIVGSVTVPAGVLGGILAVVVSGSTKRPVGDAGAHKEPAEALQDGVHEEQPERPDNLEKAPGN